MVEFKPVDLSEATNSNVSHQEPLKEFFKLVGGIVIILATLVLSVSLLVDAAVIFLPEKMEAKLAETIQPLMESEFDIIPAKENTQKLFSALTSTLPNPSAYTLHVVNDDDTVNAITGPGGNIYIFTGLLNKLKSDEQLAFVLGHELGHARHRHVVRSLGKGIIVATALSIALPNSGVVSEGVSSLLNIGMLSYSREQEYEADYTSITLLQQQGLDPHKGITFFKVLSDVRSSGSTSILSTHPTDNERVTRLEALLNAS